MFSHPVTTDQRIACSCRRARVGSHGCISCTLLSPSFFPPKPLSSSKGNQRRKYEHPHIHLKHRIENYFIPRFPSLQSTSPKQQILQTVEQSAGFLSHARFAPRRKKLYVVAQESPEHSFKQGMVLHAQRQSWS